MCLMSDILAKGAEKINRLRVIFKKSSTCQKLFHANFMQKGDGRSAVPFPVVIYINLMV